MKTFRIFCSALALLLLAMVVTAGAGVAGDPRDLPDTSAGVTESFSAAEAPNAIFRAIKAEKAKRAKETEQAKRARITAARSKAMQTVEYAVGVQRGISGVSYDAPQDYVEESATQDSTGARYVVPVFVKGTIQPSAFYEVYFVEVWVSDDAEWVELKGCKRVTN